MKLSSPVGRRHSRIEIIPLIDIMFFLLASFMMISLQLSKSQNQKVNLPIARFAKPDFNASMVNIAVDDQGGFWLEKKPITLSGLGAALTNRFKIDTNLPVYVSADKNTTHGDMVVLYDLVRRVGVQKVSFMVTSATGGATDGPINPP